MFLETMNLLKLAISSIVFLSFVVLIGCGAAATPSEAIGRKVFENDYATPVEKGVLKINSFKKINGQSYEILGVKGYKLEFEAEVEYLQDVKGQGMFSLALTTLHKKGDVDKRKGSITFEQTEKGWKAQDGKVY